jgi:hypothetical protein
MHGFDLTPEVQTGLAWYYLLVALMNIGAAAHWVFWSRGQKLLAMEQYLVTASGTLYGILALGWLFGLGEAPFPVLYLIGAVANFVALGVTLPAAIYQGVMAGTIWSACAILFQILGLFYAFDVGPVMPLWLRDVIDAASGAVTFFFGSVLLFWAFLYFRAARVMHIPIGRQTLPTGEGAWKTLDIRVPFGLTDPPVIWAVLNGVLLFFGLSMTDFDFRLIVAKPDNVPITMMVFTVGYFTWLFLRKAVINDQRLAQGLRPVEAEDGEKVLVWPDLVYTEMLASIVCTVVLVLWSILLRAPLEEWSNLTKTPNPSKAPWYFLGLQEMLVYYDPWAAGVVFPSLIIFGLMAIPFIDFNKQGSGYFTFAQRKFSIVVFMFGFIVLWVLMVMLGTFLRGPGWNFFGPYQYWDPHMVLPLNNVDLADFFWVHLLGRGKPTDWKVRELPGFVVVLGYFMILPPVLAKTLFRRFFIRMGFARYIVFVVLVLSMAALPIKMLLRWSFNLKYVIHIDEYFFNI